MAYRIYKIYLTSLLAVICLAGSDPSCTDLSVSQQQGTLISPNYPQKFPDYTSCSWTIKIPEEYLLSIRLLDLNIEVDDPSECNGRRIPCCSRNWLSLQLPIPPFRPQLFCGNQSTLSFNLPDILDKATIKFHSSKNSIGGRGFKLKFALVPKKKKVTCNEREFACYNGEQCIDGLQLCDGVNDCEDRSDEADCTRLCDEKGLTSCPDAHHVCYNVSFDACAKEATCPKTIDEDWISCKDWSACFRNNQLCDGTPDCNDASDETGCQHTTVATRRGGIFLCDNWKFVTSYNVCDGSDDCGDFSDEAGCLKPSLETAIILGSLSCSLLVILFVSYVLHAHRGAPRPVTRRQPAFRPLVNAQPYYMHFREPPPPYPADIDPPPGRRRYRRHRRHNRATGPAPPVPQIPVPDEEASPEPEEVEQVNAFVMKAPEEEDQAETPPSPPTPSTPTSE